MGKGSKARPLAVPREEFNKSFEGIFGKKPAKVRWVPPALPESKIDNKTEDK